jgi:hypothetical protein
MKNLTVLSENYPTEFGTSAIQHRVHFQRKDPSHVNASE